MVTARISRRASVLLVLALLALTTILTTQPARAAACRNLGVYTDWLYSPPNANPPHDPNPAPAIWIWNNGIPPTPSKMTIYYNGWWQETVPSPSDWGVRTDAPQPGAGNGWLVYYIAGRWYNNAWNDHGAWNEDGRWKVTYCG
jgi:hypothetical protein